MKKILFLLGFFLPIKFYAQNVQVSYPFADYNNYMENYSQTASQWYGELHPSKMNVASVSVENHVPRIRIKTLIPKEIRNISTIFITGHDEIQGNINLQISWQSEGVEFRNLFATTAGSFIPKILIGNYIEGGYTYIAIVLDAEENGGMYNSHFDVSILVNGKQNTQSLNQANGQYNTNTTSWNVGAGYSIISQLYFMYWGFDESADLENPNNIEIINSFKEINSKSIFSERLEVDKVRVTNSLKIESGNQNYYVNRRIEGSTNPSLNVSGCTTAAPKACNRSYILLHRAAYNQIPKEEAYVIGKIVAKRGGININSEKLDLEINSSTANLQNKVSLINKGVDASCRLVLVDVYIPPLILKNPQKALEIIGNQSLLSGSTTKCLAIEIDYYLQLTDFSFTGYASGEVLAIRNNYYTEGEFYLNGSTNPIGPLFSNIQEINNDFYYPISIQGPLKLEKLKNTNSELSLTTDEFGNVQLSSIGGYWKKQVGVNNKTIYYDNPVAIGNLNSANSNDIFSNSTSVGTFQLAVGGKIGARKVQVTQNQWADYVFDKKYKLRNLSQLERYIKTNKHLPEIPTTEQVLKEGVDIGEMQRLLLKKVEELTLYIIEQQKQIDELKKKVR